MYDQQDFSAPQEREKPAFPFGAAGQEVSTDSFGTPGVFPAMDSSAESLDWLDEETPDPTREQKDPTLLNQQDARPATPLGVTKRSFWNKVMPSQWEVPPAGEAAAEEESTGEQEVAGPFEGASDVSASITGTRKAAEEEKARTTQFREEIPSEMQENGWEAANEKLEISAPQAIAMPDETAPAEESQIDSQEVMAIFGGGSAGGWKRKSVWKAPDKGSSASEIAETPVPPAPKTEPALPESRDRLEKQEPQQTVVETQVLPAMGGFSKKEKQSIAFAGKAKASETAPKEEFGGTYSGFGKEPQQTAVETQSTEPVETQELPAMGGFSKKEKQTRGFAGKTAAPETAPKEDFGSTHSGFAKVTSGGERIAPTEDRISPFQGKKSGTVFQAPKETAPAKDGYSVFGAAKKNGGFGEIKKDEETRPGPFEKNPFAKAKGGWPSTGEGKAWKQASGGTAAGNTFAKGGMWKNRAGNKTEQAGVCCPECGAQNPPQAQFCCMCGLKLHTVSTCPACGKKLEPGMKFCPFCGKML